MEWRKEETVCAYPKFIVGKDVIVSVDKIRALIRHEKDSCVTAVFDDGSRACVEFNGKPWSQLQDAFIWGLKPQQGES